jgi:hypothetical protein
MLKQKIPDFFCFSIGPWSDSQARMAREADAADGSFVSFSLAQL